MTQAIVTVARPLEISVHDHIIVGKDGHASLKGMRLICWPTLHRSVCAQYDLTPRHAIVSRFFYARGERWSFHTAKTQSGHSAAGIYSIIVGFLCTRQRQRPYRFVRDQTIADLGKPA